jgi:hypothetical protein
MHKVKIENNGQNKTVFTNLPIAHESKRKKVWLDKEGGKYIQAPNHEKRAKRLKAKQHLIISGLQTKCIDRIKNPSLFGLHTQDQLKHYLVEAVELLKKIYAHWERFRDHCLSICTWLNKEAFA